MFTSSSLGASSNLFSPQRGSRGISATSGVRPVRPTPATPGLGASEAAASSSSSSSVLSTPVADGRSRRTRAERDGASSSSFLMSESTSRSFVDAPTPLLSPIKRPATQASRAAGTPFPATPRATTTPGKSVQRSDSSRTARSAAEAGRRYRTVLHESARHSVECLAELNRQVAAVLSQRDDLSLCSGGVEEALGLVWVAAGSVLYVWRADEPEGHLLRVQLPPSHYPDGSAAAGLVALFAYPAATGAAARTAEWWTGLSVFAASPDGAIYYTYPAGRAQPPARLEASLAAQLPPGATLSRQALVVDASSATVLLSTSAGALYACQLHVHPSTLIPTLHFQHIRPFPAPLTATHRRQQRSSRSTPSSSSRSFWKFWSRPTADDDTDNGHDHAHDVVDVDDDESNADGSYADDDEQGESNVRHMLTKNFDAFIIRDGYLEHFNVRKSKQIEQRWHLVPLLQQRLAARPGTSISLLATQLTSNDSRLAVLAASYGGGSSVVQYHIFFLPVSSLIPSTSSSAHSELTVDEAFTTLPFRPSYAPSQEAALLWSVSFVVPPLGSSAFVCMPNLVIFLQLPSDTRELDSMELVRPEERLLATGTFLSLPNAMVGLSLSHGVLVLSQPESIIAAVPPSPATTAAAALSSSSSSSTTTGRSFLENEFHKFCAALGSTSTPLAAARPPGSRVSPPLSAGEEREILELSAKMLNAPANFNPRWAEAPDSDNKRLAVHPQTSVFLSERLEWKQRQHARFRDFLEALGFWSRMSPSGRTRFFDHASLLAAALALRRLQNDLENEPSDAKHRLFDAMAYFVRDRPLRLQAAAPALTVQDEFYERVTEVQHIIGVLVQKAVGDETAPSIGLASQVVICMVGTAVAQHRSAPAAFLDNDSVGDDDDVHDESRHNVDKLDVVDMAQLKQHSYWWWTHDVRQQLYKLLQTMSRLDAQPLHGRHAQQPPPTAFKTIATYVFDAHVQLLSICRQDCTLQRELQLDYDRKKQKIVGDLLARGHIEVARSLGETYQEFGTLMHICHEHAPNPADCRKQLLSYIDRYTDAGSNFVAFACQWYENKSMWYELLNLPAVAAGRPSQERQLSDQLAVFLADRPRLSWLHDVANKRYVDAANTLYATAECEKTLLARRRTLLSLSKLSAYAARGDGDAFALSQDYWDLLEAQDYLIDMQKRTGQHQRGARHAFDSDDIAVRPYSLEELVRYLVSGEHWQSETDSVAATLCVAFDLVYNCSVLEPPETIQRIFMLIFSSALDASPWPAIASELKDVASDVRLREVVEATPLYQLACYVRDHQPKAQQLSLPSMISMLSLLVSAYVQQLEESGQTRNFVSQLLASTLDIIGRLP